MSLGLSVGVKSMPDKSNALGILTGIVIVVICPTKPRSPAKLALEPGVGVFATGAGVGGVAVVGETLANSAPLSNCNATNSSAIIFFTC